MNIESDRASEWFNSIFQNFFEKKVIHLHSIFTDRGPSIAERIFRTVSNLLKKPVFDKSKL